MAQQPAGFVPDGFVPDGFELEAASPQMNFATVNGQKVPVDDGPLDLVKGAWDTTLGAVPGAINAVAQGLPLPKAIGGGGVIEGPKKLAGSFLDAMNAVKAGADEAWAKGDHLTAVRKYADWLASPIFGITLGLDAAADKSMHGQPWRGAGEGIGLGLGLTLPEKAPEIKSAVAAGVRKVLPDNAAAMAERGAANRIVDVIAPKVGANKARFGGMAEDVAPDLAKDMAAEGAPWTRQGLHDVVSGKLEDATARLDAVSDARLNARTFPTQPIIEDLLRKRKALTAEAVDASLPEQVKSVRQSAIVDESGRPISVTESKTVPLGQDVVPGPNAARVAQIDKAIAELKALGPVARYEPLRVIRQAYDGPAKAVYNPSMTADFLKAQGGKLGAADVTGTLRESLAKMDPETAAANAPYSLYRTANDVLEATQEIQRSRPKVGRQIFSRMTGVIGGNMAAGPGGAAAGFIFAPIIDNAVAGGLTTQLKTAALMQKLAGAIRRGDLGYVTSLTSQLRAMSLAGATKSALTTGAPVAGTLTAGQASPAARQGQP